MYNKNKVGDKTEPWGTPALILSGFDMAPSTRTAIERSDKKLRNQSMKTG